MNIGITIALIVVFVLMLIMPYFSQRKSRQAYMEMLSNLKVGDMVKTGGGIIGKITKISDKGEIKTVVLETGSKTNKSYLELDVSMIYCVLKKSTKAENVDVEETEIQDVAETEVEEKTEEVEKTVDKKPAKKTTTKKSTAKKTTKKD